MNASLLPSCMSDNLPRVEEALTLLRAQFPPIARVQSVPLGEARGHIAAQDMQALVTMPPCDRSAMDGYAFRHGDDAPLLLAGRALPGAPYKGTVKPGQCVGVATGAALPAGCDTVAAFEHCLVDGDRVIVRAKAPGANVRRMGEDFRAGTALLRAGTRLDARHIGLLAAAGHRRVPVKARVNVALISIGNELLQTGMDGIADANRPMLQALLSGLACDVHDLGILPDNRALLARQMADAALSKQDVLLLSAGTSAGEEDHVRAALLDCGGQLLFAGVAIRPGKPVCFGRIGRTLVIALPGNPAAAYVTALVLALPLLRHLMEMPATKPEWQTVRAAFHHTKNPGLREYVRARLARTDDGMWQALPCCDNGPAMLTSLTQADGLVCLEEERMGCAPGDAVAFASFADLESP